MDSNASMSREKSHTDRGPTRKSEMTGRRRPNLPARVTFARRFRQEAGKVRFLAPSSRPAEMTFGRFFTSAFVSTRRRFVYVKNDKVASSFITRSLTASEKRADGARYRSPFLDRRRSPLLTPAELTRSQWETARAEYFIFTFARNPFSRILSCYLDRIVGRDESYYVLQKRIGFGAGVEPTFGEFLEMLGQPGVLDLDTHWKPQHVNIASEYYDYRFIGHFEHFGDEFEALLRWIYGPKMKFGQVRRGTSATSRLDDYYEAETTRRVADLYAADFELFGYDDGSPLTIEPRQRHRMEFVKQPRARR